MLSKIELRGKLQSHRQLLTKEEANEASALIEHRVLGLLCWKAATRVHIYSSNARWNEVRTAQLRHSLHEHYPRLIIETSAVTAAAEFPENQYDVVIVPVLGFDNAGYRLGLGTGWYDRFLAMQPQAYKVGLAYSWAQLDLLPRESHDIPLDCIITEAEIIQF